MNAAEKIVLCGTDAGKFSMTEYDDVSGKLGGLEATTAGILRSVNVIESAVKDMTKESVLTGSSLNAAHKYIEEIKLELRNEIRPFIEDSKTKESEAKGWTSAMNWVSGIIGGGVGMFGSYILKILGFH